MNITDLITGSAIALVGTVIGWFLNRNSSIDLLERQEFRRNASDFIVTFTDIIDFLESDIPETNPDKFHSRFERSFPKIAEGVIKFRIHLPKTKRTDFNIAWQNYRRLRGSIQNQKKEDYNETKLKSIVQTHIDDLLKFTEYEYLK